MYLSESLMLVCRCDVVCGSRLRSPRVCGGHAAASVVVAAAALPPPAARGWRLRAAPPGSREAGAASAASLVQAGDAAFVVKKYEEAVAHFTAALGAHVCFCPAR